MLAIGSGENKVWNLRRGVWVDDTPQTVRLKYLIKKWYWEMYDYRSWARVDEPDYSKALRRYNFFVDFAYKKGFHIV